MNIYYDVEDNHYRTYPDGDIATTDQMRELIENKNLSIVKLQQENQKYKEVIDKAIEYINHFSKESKVKIYGLPKCKVFIGDIEELLEILKEVE